MRRFKQGWVVGCLVVFSVATLVSAVSLLGWHGELFYYPVIALGLGVLVGALRLARAQQAWVATPLLAGMLLIAYGALQGVPLSDPVHIYILAVLTWYWSGVGLFLYGQARRQLVTQP